MRCYLFDIDGTIADCSHRIHLIEQQPKDWRAFFASVKDDAPIPHTIELARHLAKAGMTIVFVSGRSSECREQTSLWLANSGLPGGPLYMRKEGDHRDDSIVKIELLAKLREDGFDPVMAFDDRDRVVAAWRGVGIPCAQVAPGNF
jgi:predicted secreted acid phosphatase